MTRYFKKRRFGPLVVASSGDPDFFAQVHVIFGGTGAVGGETTLQLLSVFEEALAMRDEPPDARPTIVITGHTRREIRSFTRLLHGVHERDHGRPPERLEGTGYRTATGIAIEMRTLSIEPSIPEMRNAARLSDDDLEAQANAFLTRMGGTAASDPSEKVRLLARAIREGGARPFSGFLESYRSEHGVPASGTRFRSVVVTIPLASVATYQLGDLELFAKAMGIESAAHLEEVKEVYLDEFPEDLAHVAREEAHEVLVAHTTGVGGMYDESPDGERPIRLGFAHSALGAKLRTKQLFAERLSDLYASRGIRMLITAAAIGIDAIEHRMTPPLQAAVRRELERTVDRTHPIVPEADLQAGTLKVYEPTRIDLAEPRDEELRFDHGVPLVLDYVLRSGENGYFTVANTDALYRVMRVASASELGLCLARTALFGDDPQCPDFVDNVCYYTETDNSRQVFDLLNQPLIVSNQLTGLQAKALQDLGSAKHQGELHTLGLLILLHRLKTLDLSHIEPHVDLAYFDPVAYFERHSKALTLDEAAMWDVPTLARELGVLVRARTERDLEVFHRAEQPFPERQQAVHRVLMAVIRAVWTIPSLGSPILYEEEGRTKVLTGFYAGPVDQILSHRTSLQEFLRRDFEARGVETGEEAFVRFADFHFAQGFVDLRPRATLVSAHAASEPLVDRVTVYTDEEAFIDGVHALTPYSYYTASGLVALMARIRYLAQSAKELHFELGTSNEFRAHFARDEAGQSILVPGVVEAFRMVAEGLEKNTGSERLDGPWGFGRMRRRS